MRRADARTTARQVRAFEAATRDLVGLALRSVERLEISLPQFRLLLVLHEHGPTSATQCAHLLGVAGSSVTRLADRLSASGHLVRETDPDNRSAVIMQLTDSGRLLVRQATAHRRRELTSLLNRLDPDERAACALVLERLHGVSGDDAPGDSPALLPW